MNGEGITLDDRVGSKHYAEFLPGAIVSRLDYGDAAWLASDGRLIGVEIKTVPDLVNCMHSGRLADFQIPGLRSLYDFSYLLVEGIYRAEPESGILQRYKGDLGKWGHWYDVASGPKRLMYSAFAGWLETLSMMGGVSLRLAPDPAGTASLLQSLFSWWSHDRHKSFNVLQQSSGDSALLTRPTTLRRIAACLPLIGWERSEAVVQRFRSLREMVDASEKDWTEIEGIGKGIAKRVMEVLHGNTET